ncbi:NAD-dependent epimerase/dehydratase family protein [Alienimonas californiensis]|uniref:dTDP-glucose 4,6-dehydratase n=1 Tax=Alienimonas californiensis TaxID=2527989 RepID=A0A517P4C5_9PLAN|nr:NAD-dependent epimerase/dehydratase family protein [Alienimonas californiensis]QDT14203.1 dTDP-glucose 4,6-dehydratase [Alienimonas californiensis]
MPNGQILLTGAAGFIGAAVGERLLGTGAAVVGVDDLNVYYSPSLKRARLERLFAAAERGGGDFDFHQVDVADRGAVERVFAGGPFDRVIHLAAQAGVRHSITHPHDYAAANLTGFLNVLEGCRRQAETGPDDPPHLVFASSSSIYGASVEPVLAADQPADHPISLYAATKRANELMAHSYAHLYGLPCTGVRFFTVYGPWGRPDMAVWKFTQRVLAGDPIDVYGGGGMRRGFTYIDDAAEGVVRLAARPPAAPTDGAAPASPDRGTGPFRTYNLGASEPVELMRLIEVIETACGRPAEKRFLPMQPGDVISTAADVGPLAEVTGLVPVTSIEEGVGAFVKWYREYHAR